MSGGGLGLVGPRPRPSGLPRWTRNAEFLLYVVPVGTISAELYARYLGLLQAHGAALPLRALTRPGGYAAELSPFRSFAWDGPGDLRFRFVSTTDRIRGVDGEDVHACNRPIGVLGLCHCPTTPRLADAYAQFIDSTRHFPGLLVQKCFAFEHPFDVAAVDECAAMTHLVMFPADHELDDGGSTVRLHLGVVLDTISVTILMSLESTVRAAMRQQAQAPAPAELGDPASFLLDTTVEPASSGAGGATTPALLARDPHAALSASGSGGGGGGGGGTSSLFGSDASRARKRQAARQRKLFGDYALLLSCVPDAIDHYLAAIELLREEERKSAATPGDTLWLAAAIEGYVYCLCQQSQDKFAVEIVERASEALTAYAKIGLHELESLLVEQVAWYYVVVVAHLGQSRAKGTDKVEEGLWVKRLLHEAIDRGLAVVPDLPPPRQVEFVVQAARMLEAIGHHRRMALLLHDAVSLLVLRHHRPSNLPGTPASTPSGAGGASPSQRQRDLRAAMRLEQLTATRLGMRDAGPRAWEVTRLRHRRRKGERRALATSWAEAEPWLVIRFHVLRQLIVVAKHLTEPYLVGKYCIELLRTLSWCDELARTYRDPSTAARSTVSSSVTSPVDLLQWPSSMHRPSGLLCATGGRGGLHPKGGAYYAPPPSIETKSRRYFSLAASSPAATVSSAAASLSSTIANTPRLLSTPRQQFSAAVNALSTKASPALSSLAQHGHQSPGAGAFGATSGSPPGVVLGAAATATSRTASGGPPDPVERTGDAGTNRAELESAEALSPGTDRAPEVEPRSAWNLRSRDEINRLQRAVLRTLEAECMVLRPSEQSRLQCLVRIDMMRVVREHSHPYFSRDHALRRWGGTGAGPGDSASGESPPAFFYNPFEKKHTRKLIDRQEDSDTGDASVEAGACEFGFPMSERIDVDLWITNPFNIDLECQQLSLWVVRDSATMADDDDTPTTTESYPSTLVLSPYERRRRVRLGFRPLTEGPFLVRGCFVKILNVRTTFSLETPISLCVVPALPLLTTAFIDDLGSETTTTVGRSGRALSRPHRPPEHAPPALLSSSSSSGICMFSSEKKVCAVIVKNTGTSAIRQLHVRASLGHPARSSSRGPFVTVFSNVADMGKTPPCADALRTDEVTVRCLVDHDGIASLLPIACGDRIVVPVEITMHGPSQPGGDGQIENAHLLTWILGYSQSTSEGTDDALQLFRESKLIVKLVALPSLLLTAVRIQPSCIEAPSYVDTGDAGVLADNVRCLVSVEVSNPTETVFLAKIRPRRNGADCAKPPSGDEWDVEIGRKSIRHLAVEIPRTPVAADLARPLAEVLNELIEIQWRTYFGTVGHLRFDPSLWSERSRPTPGPTADPTSCRCQLAPSPVLFTLHMASAHDLEDISEVTTTPPPPPTPTTTTTSEDLAFPFRFYHAFPRVPVRLPQVYLVRPFRSCAIVVQVRKEDGAWSGGGGGGGGAVVADVTVCVRPDASDHVSTPRAGGGDAVLVSGVLETRVQWAAGDDPTVHELPVHCLFLSEGRFLVTAQAAVATDGARRRVICHRPIVIHCAS